MLTLEQAKAKVVADGTLAREKAAITEAQAAAEHLLDVLGCSDSSLPEMWRAIEQAEQVRCNDWLLEFAKARARRVANRQAAREVRRQRHLTVCRSVSFACILRNIPEGKKGDPAMTISPVLKFDDPPLSDLVPFIRTYEEVEAGQSSEGILPGGEGKRLTGFEQFVADMCMQFLAVGLRVKIARATEKIKADGLVVLLISLPDDTFDSVFRALEFERFVVHGSGACVQETIRPCVRTDFRQPPGEHAHHVENHDSHVNVDGQSDRVRPPFVDPNGDEEKLIHTTLQHYWFEKDRCVFHSLFTWL